MKKIKVYLQNPTSISDSQYYKNILQYPPKDIEYTTNITSLGMITGKTRFLLFKFAKSFLRSIIDLFGIETVNAHITNDKVECDIIHCAHCLSLNKDKPWVADFEAPWQFWISNKGVPSRTGKAREIINRPNCRQLIAWTEEARREMINLFPETKGKISVIPHALPCRNVQKKIQKKVKLLFCGRYFYQKGGLHALEAIDILTKKYSNVSAFFVSSLPSEIKEKYSGNKKITFYDLMPQKKLFDEIYPQSDIFIYPGYSDTFGFGFLEAISFGLPIVTVNGYARTELVRENQTGFVIERPVLFSEKKIGEKEKIIINEIVKKSSRLIEGGKLRQTMSQNCIREIKTGKFSIEGRNKKLREVYARSLSQ